MPHDDTVSGAGQPVRPPAQPLDRRTFLLALGGAALAPPLAQLAGLPPAQAAAGEDQPPFRHGVASGDPAPDSVVIWTRVSGAGPSGVPVDWVVAEDETLTRPIRSGRAEAAPEADYTVHVTVDGLGPGTTYWYGFRVDGAASPVGRTRTAPDGPVGRVRLGACSCARYSDGFFTAYRGLATADVDLVVHLGDYIYEKADDGPRGQEEGRPKVALTLADYRSRYADARSDPDLQQLHQRHPMVAVWDDHEFADNAWQGGALEHNPDDDGAWAVRRAAAAQAWREWMPVRLLDPAHSARIWRSTRYGDLADLVLVDTRLHGRDRQVTSKTLEDLNDPQRTMLGTEQQTWLTEQVTRPGATWLFLVNQVVLTPLPVELPDVVPDNVAEDAGLLVKNGTAINPDQWDGYPPAQERLLGRLAARPGGGVVVLTGDIHSSMALENPGPDGRPAVTELVSPAVTTTTLGQRLGTLADEVFDSLVADTERVRWASLFEHGFVVLDVTPERLTAEWWHVNQIERPGGTWTLAAAFERSPDDARLHRTDRASAGSASLAEQASPKEEDEWFDPLLSVPGGIGAAVAAGAAGLALRRRSATAARARAGDDDRPS